MSKKTHIKPLPKTVPKEAAPARCAAAPACRAGLSAGRRGQHGAVRGEPARSRAEPIVLHAGGAPRTAEQQTGDKQTDSVGYQVLYNAGARARSGGSGTPAAVGEALLRRPFPGRAQPERTPRLRRSSFLWRAPPPTVTRPLPASCSRHLLRAPTLPRPLVPSTGASHPRPLREPSPQAPPGRAEGSVDPRVSRLAATSSAPATPNGACSALVRLEPGKCAAPRACLPLLGSGLHLGSACL
ncbi:hypothetical protein NDU88_004658 [Pleurodeles waltl]|uniref:Uncharacterized protein n=1 Tax=Pleurodeles waltl TaxID=8319 RepID=A0AAV7WVC3_PLEWA|nr:hypothetical protein NDU88_004658 [Pleurodeles waltl]